MTVTAQTLLGNARSVLHKLTNPGSFVLGDEERQDCYTFSLLALFALVVCIPILLRIAVINLFDWQVLITASVIAVLSVTYGLSRSRYYKVGRVLLNGLTISVVLVAVYFYPTPSMLTMALLPLFTAVVYHRICYTVLNGMISFGVLLYMTRWFPGGLAQVAVNVLLLSVVGLAIVLQASIRRNLEKKLMAQARQLAESQAQLRGAIDGSRQIFALLDCVREDDGHVSDFRLVDVNSQASERLKLVAGTLLSQWQSELVPDSYRADLMTRFHLSAEFHEAVLFEQEWPDHRWYEFQIVPVDDHLVAVSANNITERKLMEWNRLELEAEKQRGKALQKLLTNVTHDLNTPLTVIKSNTGMAQKLSDNPDQAIKLSRIDQQTDRLTHMIGDMLNLSRLEELTEAELNRSDIQFGEVLEHVVTSFRHNNHKRQSLQLSGSEALPPISIDLRRIEVALWSVLDNAVQFTPDEGKIDVFCLSDAEQAIIEIRDSGPGIPPKDLPYIFEAFYRGSAHRPANSGAGLGLAIARRIIEAHGGQIEAENLEGGGALFRVSLPLPVLEPA